MQIKLWGVRGSLPTPMSTAEYQSKLQQVLELNADKIKDPSIPIESIIDELPMPLQSVIGGETTCVEVLTDDNKQLILDMGTGARPLGLDMAERDYDNNINVLFTHTHWDHIQGWPYFQPAQNPKNNITFYSCIENLEERLVGQQKQEDYAKSSFHDSPAKKEFSYIKPGAALDLGPFHITSQPLLHPGGSVSYKIQEGGKTFIFATDTEFYGPDLSRLIHEYMEFFHNADLMIMDAQYSLQEAEQKKGWGHTAMTIAVDCCIHWQIKKLVLTHHEPAHNDTKIFELYEKANSYLDQSNPHHAPLEIFLAREGDVYDL